MKNYPLVAIVVLNYNGRECLPRALQSLQNLEYERKKVIIVDNDSRDDSFIRAKEYFPQGIFLQNEANLGFAGGMNIGIREAFRLGAEYVWLFNNDAETEVHTLARMIDFCERHENVGAVSPIISDNQGREWFVSGEISYISMRARHGRKKDEKQPYESEYLSGCAVLIRRSALEAAGLLDERYFLYYEDADLSLRIRLAGMKLFVIPSARITHGEQSEAQRKEKIYHLVYSGLIFFHDHTSVFLRPWVSAYELLRRVKNRIDIFLHRPNSAIVYQAYQDYDRTHQSR